MRPSFGAGRDRPDALAGAPRRIHATENFGQTRTRNRAAKSMRAAPFVIRLSPRMLRLPAVDGRTGAIARATLSPADTLCV
jgi:hypothetical protein